MIIKRLYAENFRNIEKCDISFSPGVNLLHGKNAQGKTNAVEAIYLFSRGRSFRAREDKDLIKFGTEGFRLRIDYEDSDGDGSLEYALFGRERLRKKNGYKILERNFVSNNAEIDIIAKNSEFTIFVEVKTRRYGTEHPSEPRPASSVTPDKQRAIIRAARGYLAFNPSPRKVRLDIIEVYYEGDERHRSVREMQHLEGAFNLDTATKGYKK